MGYGKWWKGRTKRWIIQICYWGKVGARYFGEYINFWEADWKNSSREISSQEMSTSCIPTSRNAEFDNFCFTNNKTFPLLTWLRNLKTNSLQSLLRSRLFHYHESLSMLERNVHLYKTEDLIWSATLTCFGFYNKYGMKKTKNPMSL